MQAIAGWKSHWLGCAWFWAWAVVGAAFGLGLTSLGILVALPATLAVVLMTRRRPIRGAFGLATGVGAILLLIAYIQRSGEFYNPKPLARPRARPLHGRPRRPRLDERRLAQRCTSGTNSRSPWPV